MLDFGGYDEACSLNLWDQLGSKMLSGINGACPGEILSIVQEQQQPNFYKSLVDIFLFKYLNFQKMKTEDAALIDPRNLTYPQIFKTWPSDPEKQKEVCAKIMECPCALLVNFEQAFGLNSSLFLPSSLVRLHGNEENDMREQNPKANSIKELNNYQLSMKIREYVEYMEKTKMRKNTLSKAHKVWSKH